MKNGITHLKRPFQKHGNISKEKSQRSKNKAKCLQLRLFLSLKKGKLRAKHSKSSQMAGQAPFLAKNLFYIPVSINILYAIPPTKIANPISKNVINNALLQPCSLTKAAIVATHGIYSIATKVNTII